MVVGIVKIVKFQLVHSGLYCGEVVRLFLYVIVTVSCIRAIRQRDEIANMSCSEFDTVAEFSGNSMYRLGRQSYGNGIA